LRTLRGHDNDALQPINIAGYRVIRCPLLFDQEWHKAYIKCYADYQKGILPNAGGSLDQPMKFWQIMGLIDRVFTLIREEEERNAEKQK